MAWKQSEPYSLVPVTDGLLDQFVKMESCPGDRPMSDKRVEYLKNEINAGRFRGATLASVYCRETGKVYRVNGKHTVMALMDSDRNGTMLQLEKFVADNLSDVADLYSTFDAAVNSRRSSDVNSSVCAAHPHLANLSTRTRNWLIAGLAFAKWGSNCFAKPPLARAKLVEGEDGLCTWILSTIDMIHVRKRSAFARYPVIGAMVNTWRKDSEFAKQFWPQVFDHDETDPASGYTMLAVYILRACAFDGSKSINRVNPRCLYIASIKIWNAIRANDLPKLLTVRSPDGVPEVK